MHIRPTRIGVIFDNNLKFPSHIINQVNKANRLMELIRRSYTYLDKNSFRYLFHALVRPHLEYCVPICYPFLKKDNGLIENVLRRASKRIPRISNLSYTARLFAIDMPSMRYQRWCDSSLQSSPWWRWITKSIFDVLSQEDISLK